MKNYRIKETVVTHRDGSKKSFYSIQKRHRLIFWKDLKIHERMHLYECWLDRDNYLTDNRDEALKLYDDIIKGDIKIYGVKVIPVIVQNPRIIVDKYNPETGILVGGELGFANGEKFEVNYTCQELLNAGEIFLQTNSIRKFKKNLNELKEYIGKLPRY